MKQVTSHHYYFHSKFILTTFFVILFTIFTITSSTATADSTADSNVDDVELTTTSSPGNLLYFNSVNSQVNTEKSAADFKADQRSGSVSTDDLPPGSFMVRTSPLASAASTLMFVSFKNLSVPGKYDNF